MVLEGDIGVGFDCSGACGAGFASLFGSEGFANDFGAAEEFAARRMGGLGGIRETGVVTGFVQRNARLLGNTCSRCAVGR
jgi:hypothetical protein